MGGDADGVKLEPCRSLRHRQRRRRRQGEEWGCEAGLGWDVCCERTTWSGGSWLDNRAIERAKMPSSGGGIRRWRFDRMLMMRD